MSSALRLTLLSVFQGLLVGGIITGLVLYIGVYVRNKWVLSCLFPLSVLLSLFRKRWICYAYSSAVLLIPLYYLRIICAREVSAIICLVGILHIAEAGLCFQSRTKEQIWPLLFGVLLPVENGESFAMPGWWPLFGGTDTLTALPVTAMIAYHTKNGNTYRDGLALLIYGSVITVSGILSIRWKGFLLPILILQVILHEYIIKKP